MPNERRTAMQRGRREQGKQLQEERRVGNVLLEQINTFFVQFQDYQSVDVEELLYLYNTILEVQDMSALNAFNSLANTVAKEYERKREIESVVIREDYIRPYKN